MNIILKINIGNLQIIVDNEVTPTVHYHNESTLNHNSKKYTLVSTILFFLTKLFTYPSKVYDCLNQQEA